MAVSMKSAEFQLHESLVQLQEILSLLDFDRKLYDSLEKSKAQIRTRTYHVAVMGEFKRGKSTLLNALLGAPVLPADATPATAAVSRITYGQKERAVLFYRDGSSAEIPFDGLSEAVTKLSESGRIVSSSLREAVIYYPSVICQNYIDLIDTPGLNDDARMTELTIGLLPQVDAVIVPIHARFPFSITEKQFVCQLLQSPGIHDILFVVTFLDQLDEDDYVYADYMNALSERIRREVFSALEEEEAPPDILQKAHRILDRLRICGLSASLALKAFSSGKKSLLQESRFPEFQKLLLQSLTAGQTENAFLSSSSRMEAVIRSLDGENDRKMLEFQEQEQKLERCKNAAGQFFRDLLPLLDRLLEEAQPALAAAADRLHPLKNHLMRHFSSALSSAETVSHMAIFTAIRPAVEKMPDEAASFLDARVIPEARKVFLRCLDALAQQAAEDGVFWEDAAFRAPLLDCMENDFRKVSFRFTMRPYPAVNDLSAVDTAGYMADCIDQSVTELYWLLKYTFSEIRRQWYPLAFREGNAMQSRAEDVLAQKAEALDIRRKAHLQNYPVLQKTASAILKKNQELLRSLRENETIRSQ